MSRGFSRGGGDRGFGGRGGGGGFRGKALTLSRHLEKLDGRLTVQADEVEDEVDSRVTDHPIQFRASPP